MPALPNPKSARAPASGSGQAETSIESIQLAKLNALLQQVWERNPFYSRKWRHFGLRPGPLASNRALADYPLTTRQELIADQTSAPPLGANLTHPFAAYKRFHRSSGTTRAPLFWADDQSSWRWILHCSQELYQLAGIRPEDRLFFAMRFGASSGPWIIYEGACQMGCACMASDGSDPDEQLSAITRFQSNVLVGKPSHLIALGERANAMGIDPQNLEVRKIIAAGEPGGHLQSTRSALEELWKAECFDRYGMTEAGSVAGECAAHPRGLHLLEKEFVAEVISLENQKPVPDGELGELVLTNFGRLGRPIIRYRTGDLARLLRNGRCACGRAEAILSGGIQRNSAALNSHL